MCVKVSHRPIPRLGSVLRGQATITGVDEDGDFYVELEGNPLAKGWVAVCRFRQTARDDEFEFIGMETGGVFIGRDYFSEGRAWFQLGWWDRGDSDRIIYGEWRSAPLD